MKRRLLLSCVSCLLALGLVTACNNEEEVDLNGDDGTTQNDGGGSGSDTSGTGGGSGDTEAVTLSNYTLSFTFTGEEIPEYAALYITGDFNSWAFAALTETNGAYTITLNSISVGEHEYKVVMWYDDETVSWSNCVEIVKGSGTSNATFTVEASQGDNYTLGIEAVLTETLGEKVIIENYVLSFTFVKDGESVTLEGLDLYIAGDWSGDVWELEKCTETDGVYSLTIASIFAGTHYYQGLTIEKDSVPTGWDDCEKLITDGNGGNASLVVSEEDNGAQTIEIDLSETEEEGVHFYVAFIDCDTESGKVVSSLDGNFYFEASAYEGSEEDDSYTRVNNPKIWSGENYCDATQATSSDSRVVLYSEEAIGNAEDELWVDVNNGEHWMSQVDGEPVEIPADDTQTYVCVITAWFYGWLDDTTYPSWSGDGVYWHTLGEEQTIAEYVSALSLSTATITE